MTQTWYDANFITKCSFFDMNMRPKDVCPGRTYRFYTGSPVFKFGEGLSYSTFACVRMLASAMSRRRSAPSWLIAAVTP